MQDLRKTQAYTLHQTNQKPRIRDCACNFVFVRLFDCLVSLPDLRYSCNDDVTRQEKYCI